MFHGFKPRFHKLTGKHGQKEEMETDFVLVFPGLIIGIECKSTLSGNTFKKAMKQLDRLQVVLEEQLGTGSDFKFIKCVAYQTIAENFQTSEKCESCSGFLLKYESQDMFVEKLLPLLNDAPVKPVSEINRVKFKAKVRDLLLFTSKKKKGGDAATRVADAYCEYDRRMASTPGGAVFFWNPTQFDIINKNPRCCVIQGGMLRPFIAIVQGPKLFNNLHIYVLYDYAGVSMQKGSI